MLEVDLTLNNDVHARFNWQGQVLGICGHSGSGKTTLLHALTGLQLPKSGRITLNGRVLYNTAMDIDLPTHRRRISMAFQDDRLWPHLSVRKNLEYGLKRVPRSQRRFKLEQVANWLGLTALLDRRVPNLSGGERRRVSIGRALLSSPELLLLDEPLNGLDPQNCEAMLSLIGKVVHESQVPVVVVCHQHEHLLRLTDQVLTVGDGVAEMNATDAPHALNRLALCVTEHDADNRLTHFSFENGQGHVVAAYQPDLPIDQPAIGILAANQIVMAMAPVETVSMQNRWRGAIEQIISHGDLAYCRVHLDAGPRVWVAVTHQAVREFELTLGQPTWCLFKASALQVFAAHPSQTMARGLHKHQTAASPDPALTQDADAPAVARTAAM